jgi:pSer/pThr/pTyr-binding forkhead associated (FHA) protein
VISGPDAGLEVSVSGRPVSIGKGATADLVLSDPAVSRLHAVISLEPNGFYVQDLGSTNGTEIDGVAIERAPLRPGARLRIGASIVEFAPRTRNLMPVLSAEDELEGLVGASAAMREVYAMIRLVAPTEATAVLRGETGTGK